MFTHAVPAPVIGVAFAGSMECKTPAKPDWLDWRRASGGQFRMLHAVVGLTTVEECRARD